MSKSPKVIITGTGRAGTTVLVKLFTLLGMPTGFTKKDFAAIHKNGGGLEFYCTGPNQGPLLVKAPQYWNMIPKMDQWYDVRFVIMPIRNLKQAAASRAALPNGSPGSLWGANNQKEQEDHNTKLVYEVVRECAKNRIRLITLPFPEFVNDPMYTYRMLEPIWKRFDVEIKPQKFLDAFHEVMDPKKVKTYD